MKFELEVYMEDEYICFDEEDAKITVEVSNALEIRIRQMQLAVSSVDAYYMTEFDYTPDFGVLHIDGDPVRSDVEMLHVSQDEFWWTGYLKHTNIKISTHRTWISNL